MAVANTVLYPIDYVIKFQERLDKDTNWKQVCKVDISNKRVLTNPYMSTVPALQAHTRGTAYTHQTFALTTEAVRPAPETPLPETNLPFGAIFDTRLRI